MSVALELTTTKQGKEVKYWSASLCFLFVCVLDLVSAEEVSERWKLFAILLRYNFGVS